MLLTFERCIRMEAELEKKRLSKIAQEERSRKRTQIVAEAQPRAEDDDRIQGGSQAFPPRTSSPSASRIPCPAPIGADGARDDGLVAMIAGSEGPVVAARFRRQTGENNGVSARSSPIGRPVAVNTLSFDASGAGRGAVEDVAQPRAGPERLSSDGRGSARLGPSSMTEVGARRMGRRGKTW